MLCRFELSGSMSNLRIADLCDLEAPNVNIFRKSYRHPSLSPRGAPGSTSSIQFMADLAALVAVVH
jgi:hypothetical protein